MVRVEFVTGNDAFQGDAFQRSGEAARIFERIVSEIKHGGRGGTIVDRNGNTVGKWENNDD